MPSLGTRISRSSACMAMALVLAVVVGACGGATSTPTTPPAATPTGPVATGPVATGPVATGPASSLSTTDWGHFDGVKVNVAAPAGANISDPLKQAATTWEQQTGATVTFTQMPYSDLYQKEITDAASGTNAFTLYTMASSWMGDFARAGYAMDLTNVINTYPGLNFQDILPFYRNVSSSYNKKIYAVPFDGDMQLLFYRSDLLAKDNLQVPKTWDDFLAIAKYYNGKDFNGDGKPDYGTCLPQQQGGVGAWSFNSVLSSFTQALGTSQGAFFGDNMTPLVNNEAMGAALDFWKAAGQYGPPGMANLDQTSMYGFMQGGRCAIVFDWPDSGVQALSSISTIKGKLGTAMLPGSTKVLDRSTGKLVACTATTCPNAIDGVNHAPFAAFGGWTGMINAKADPKAQQAALSFISYVSSPAFSNWQVTWGSGMNPFRYTQTDAASAATWTKAGMDSDTQKTYLGAINASLSSPNTALDLRIAQSATYTNTIEDQAIAQFLAGQLTKEQAMKQIFDGWNQLTDKIGRSDQEAAYTQSLGQK